MNHYPQKTSNRSTDNQHGNRTLSISTAKPKALVLSAKGADSVPDYLQEALENIAAVQYIKNLDPLDPQHFISLASPYEYLAITRRAVLQFDRQIIKALPRLKGVSVYSTGIEWIDTACLKEHDICLASLPDYCSNAVAESAVGMMFMVAHKLHLRYLKSIKSIPETVSLRGFELKNCTVGIIGFGQIGRLIAEKTVPLCHQVWCYDLDEEKYKHAPNGVYPGSLKNIVATCNFIIVCASQSFDQAEIFDTKTYQFLRPTSVVINVGRISLLNHNLLVEMVKQQRIRSYVYDDLMQQDDFPNAPEYGKILPIGHSAWHTDEALELGTSQWIKNLETLCLTP